MTTETKIRPKPAARSTVKKLTTKSKVVKKVKSTEIVVNPVFIETGDLDLIVMSNGTQLSRSDFFVIGDDIDKVLESIKNEVSSHIPDITTAKGRSLITKTVSIVTSCKTYLEAQGKDLSAEYKAIPGKIDKNRAKVKEFLSNLQTEIRKPLTDWQEEQAEIKKKKEEKEAAEKLLAEIESCHELALLMNEKFDHEIQLEIARLKKERIDNDERIAKEAADKATAEAQRLAKKEIDDAKIAKQQAIDDKEKADKELLEAQNREKLLKEQAEQTQLNNEWLVYISEAYQINSDINYKKQTELAAAQAETQRLADIEQARQKEIQRQADEKETQRLAQVKLEANTNHVSAVRCEIKKHLMSACGIDEKLAVKVVKSLLHFERVTINY